MTCHFCRTTSTTTCCCLVNMLKSSDWTIANKCLKSRLLSHNLIGSLCVYKCGKCSKKFPCQSSLKQHETNYSHKCGKNIIECLEKAVYHRCKLCQKSILCDRHSLYRHLFWSHGCTLQEYCKKSDCTLVKIEPNPNALLTNLKQSQHIESLCVFSCKICTKKYTNSNSFSIHTRTHKNYPKGDILSGLVTGSSYRCDKCQKLMLCDKTIIYSHMKSVHGQKNVACINPNSKKRIAYNILCASFLKETPISMTTWRKRILPISKIPVHEVSSNIGDLCSFTCPDCDSPDFTNWRALREHCLSLHGSKICYNFSFVSVARCHACLICPKAILCDRLFLKDNLQSVHGKKLSDYEKTYLRNGGKVLPTFLRFKADA